MEEQLTKISRDEITFRQGFGRVCVGVDRLNKDGRYPSMNVPYPFYMDGRKLSRANTIKYCLNRLGYTL